MTCPEHRPHVHKSVLHAKKVEALETLPFINHPVIGYGIPFPNSVPIDSLVSYWKSGSYHRKSRIHTQTIAELRLSPPGRRREDASQRSVRHGVQGSLPGGFRP